MYTAQKISKNLLMALLLACTTQITRAQDAASPANMSELRKTIDSLDKQFSRLYYEGDSVALYNMYTRDASLGSHRGKEILAALGGMIRNSISHDTRTIVYHTTSLNADGEFLIEVGTYEILDSKGTARGSGKYLVVWKQEDSTWKLYRDIGL